MNKAIEIGLKFIIVVVVGGIVYKTAESVLKDTIQERILAQLISAIYIALIWTLALMIVAIFGIYFDVSGIVSWIIDGMIITYILQGVISLVGMTRTILDIFSSGTQQFIIKIFNISILGILQAILIPLAGILFVMGTVSLARSYLGITYGGGFFSWALESIKITTSYIINFF